MGLSFQDLEKKTKSGEIDTVLVCFVDMQGRLMGKRFHAGHFIDGAYEETHCCNYLLATDLMRATPDGYASTSWERGYGDYVMKPDLAPLRPVPWLEGTVMVLCDILDHHTHEEISHSPRAVLKKQIKRLEAMGYDAMMATELEFFLFEKSYDEIRKEKFRDLEPISGNNEDYHIFQTTREEHVMRPIRNHLWNAGIPIENSKGEAETGQEELNIKYAAAMDTADYHSIAKHAIKEIAFQQGHAVTFLPKWHHDKVGSSSHVHQSLWKDGKPAFYDAKEKLGMSALMKTYMAGLLKYAADYTYSTATNASRGVALPRPASSGRSTTAPPDTASAAMAPNRCAWNVASAGPTSTPTSPWPPRSPPASKASRKGWTWTHHFPVTPIRASPA